MILNYYKELGIDTLIEHINELEYYEENFIDTLWNFAIEEDKSFAEKIKKYKDNKDTMSMIESATLYEDLVNEAMNIFGYKWDKYYEVWSKIK
jgi:hypothetical protein